MAKEDAEEKKERAREAWKIEHHETMRRQSEARRSLCTVLGFPEVCDDARCRRAHRCAGDVDACFRLFWPHVPENIKNTIRRTITLVAGGMAPAEALREAEAYAEERERKDEEVAMRWPAMRAGNAPAEPQAETQAKAAPVTRSPSPGPRIRSL